MTSFDEINPAWKNHEAYSVENAVALMAGVDPNSVVFDPDAVRFHGSESVVIGADAINKVYGYFKMLKSAIEDGKLKAHIIHSARLGKNDNDNPGKDEGVIYKYEWFDRDKDDIGRHDIIYSTTPDWSKTTIRRDHLITWLRDMKHNDICFNPDSGKPEDKYWDMLDSSGECFSVELQAQIRAWREVTNPQSKHYYKKHETLTIKQVFVACLRENAESWFLIEKDERTPEQINSGVKLQDSDEKKLENIAAVANWSKSNKKISQIISGD